MAAVGHLEPMGLREVLELAVAVELAGGGGLLVPDVADALEEEERQDVAHPVGAAERAAAEDVGGFPEVGFEGVERERGARGIDIPHHVDGFRVQLSSAGTSR